jgi:hypothetical protein
MSSNKSDQLDCNAQVPHASPLGFGVSSARWFTAGRWLSLCTILCITIFLLTACDPGETIPPTEIPITILAPSPTVRPIVPTVPDQDTSNVNVSAFTPAAGVVSQGNPSVTITPSPVATEVVIPLSFVTNDGLAIAADFYGAPTRPAPTVLLLHMNDSNKESWPLQHSSRRRVITC